MIVNRVSFPDLKAHLQKHSEEKHKGPPQIGRIFDHEATQHDMRAQNRMNPDVARYPSVQCLQDLAPNRILADNLVDLYFSSLETTFRILHKP